MLPKGLERKKMGRGDLDHVDAYEKKGMQRIALAVCADANKRPVCWNRPAAKGRKGLESMADKPTVKDQLDILGKLVDLGGEDRVLTQTISKLLEYAIDKHQHDVEDISSKLRALEEQFHMPSDLFYQKFHRGELGDEEEFFRWDALVQMRQRLQQRLSILQTSTST
jgi:hypothetical protein